MTAYWGEFVNPKEMERRLAELEEAVASLLLEVAELKRKQNDMALLNAAPIGAFTPRNRRF